jgi:hypothetical protein
VLSYPGEGQEIFAKDAVKFDGSAFLPEDIVTAKVWIWEGDWSALVAGPFDMAYSEDDAEWQYVWDAVGAEGGVAYKAWVELTPTDGLPMVSTAELWVAADPRAA